ncbi:MAG: serine/threonine protein kinase [Alphaproteobacteria bacterium]
MPQEPEWRREVVLKADLFSCVEKGYLVESGEAVPLVRRDVGYSRWWLRPVALYLANREAKALRALEGFAGVPRLVSWRHRILLRSWIPGRPMNEAMPTDQAYYAAGIKFLSRLHRTGIAHNDLAKAPNWLVTPEGLPAVVDFQLASIHRKRNWYFRMLAREDLRHLLKLKHWYCPENLTARQRRIVETPSLPSRIWMATFKRLYNFVTRRVIGWEDREGARDRWW